jgi:tetratricopeptide (TPR) repeat protein
MHHKSIISFLTITILVLFVPKWPNATPFQENPLTKAILLFDKGNFKEAEPLFRKILDERPDDFMVNYFFGACRTENGHYSDNDLSYLLKASKEVTPLDIDYYFGIQYHSKNKWDKALVHYKQYKSVASINDQEKVNLSLKMEQCSNKINPFKSDESDEPAVVLIGAAEIAAVSAENITEVEENMPLSESVLVETTITEMVEKDTSEIEAYQFDAENDSVFQLNEITQNGSPEQLTEDNNESQTKLKLAEEPIFFNINGEITYIYVSHFKTAEGEIYFKEGSSKQKELDEAVKRTEELREKYKTSKSWSEKDSIGKQILELESQTFELKNVVKQLFIQAKTVESGYWQNAAAQETESFIRELNAAEQEIRNKNATQIVTATEYPDLIIPSAFQVDKPTERPATKPKASGITYKIQIGAYSRGIPNNMKSVFSKISVIRKVENYTDEKGVVVYTTGNLTNYEDALVMQKQVQQEGIKDAIIAAYLNGKRIPLEQAKEIEKEK